MHCDIQPFAEYAVTPFVGVWIETVSVCRCGLKWEVTPFVGVWIETENTTRTKKKISVTPFVGVWIETLIYKAETTLRLGHTLRGCVD